MGEPDRGVTDLIGFVLVASLILVTLGVVFVAGFTGLEDARSAERIQNAERAFAVLADNVEDIHDEGAPGRATEVKLADAQLSYGRPTTITVNVTNAGAGGNTVFSTSLDPIVYSTGSASRIVYENGAVAREDRDGAVLKRRPPGVFWAGGSRSETTVHLVQTRQTGSSGVGGDGTFLVRTRLVSTEVLGSLTTPGADGAGDLDGDGTAEYAVDYTIETTPTRAVLWRDHLNRAVSESGNRTAFDNHDVDGDGAVGDDPTCGLDGGTVHCRLMVEHVHVSVTRIDVAFE